MSFLTMAAREPVYYVKSSMGAFGGPTRKNHRFYSNHSKVSARVSVGNCFAGERFRVFLFQCARGFVAARSLWTLLFADEVLERSLTAEDRRRIADLAVVTARRYAEPSDLHLCQIVCHGVLARAQNNSKLMWFWQVDSNGKRRCVGQPAALKDSAR